MRQHNEVHQPHTSKEWVVRDGRTHGGVPAISLSFPVSTRVFFFYDFVHFFVRLNVFVIVLPLEFWEMIFRSLFSIWGQSYQSKKLSWKPERVILNRCDVWFVSFQVYSAQALCQVHKKGSVTVPVARNISVRANSIQHAFLLASDKKKKRYCPRYIFLAQEKWLLVRQKSIEIAWTYRFKTYAFTTKQNTE